MDQSLKRHKVLTRAFGQKLKIIKYTEENVWTEAENLKKYCKNVWTKDEILGVADKNVWTEAENLKKYCKNVWTKDDSLKKY
jgi:beta-glucanase (GH16 family)